MIKKLTESYSPEEILGLVQKLDNYLEKHNIKEVLNSRDLYDLDELARYFNVIGEYIKKYMQDIKNNG